MHRGPLEGLVLANVGHAGAGGAPPVELPHRIAGFVDAASRVLETAAEKPRRVAAEGEIVGEAPDHHLEVASGQLLGRRQTEIRGAGRGGGSGRRAFGEREGHGVQARVDSRSESTASEVLPSARAS